MLKEITIDKITIKYLDHLLKWDVYLHYTGQHLYLSSGELQDLRDAINRIDKS